MTNATSNDDLALADEIERDYPAVDVTSVVFSPDFAGVGCCVIPQDRVLAIIAALRRSAAPPAGGLVAWHGPGNNDRHYLSAIRKRLERLYDEHPNDARLREHISDELDWVDEKLEDGAPATPQPQEPACREADEKLGDLLAKVLSHSSVDEAMQDAWNDICSDTGCHPLDIEHGKGKVLTFSPGHWANQVAKRLFLRALRLSSPANSTASPGEDAEIIRLRDSIAAIQKATVEGRVCDDVAWFDGITTLHDFCDQVLNGPDSDVPAQDGAAQREGRLEAAGTLIKEWMAMFNPSPAIDVQQFEMLQYGIAGALMSKAEIEDASSPDHNSRLSTTSREALEAAETAGPAPWPNGCHSPNSCDRNGRCVYVGCRHDGADIRALAVEAKAALSALSVSVTAGREEKLHEERNVLNNSFGGGAFHDGMVRQRIEEIDAELAALTGSSS